MSKLSLSSTDILTEGCLCGVCRGYLSIPPIVYSIKLGFYVCGRCYDKEMYSNDIIIRQSEYETEASTYLFPCSNDDCDEKVEFGHNAIFHEKICEYGQIKCPISNFFRGFLKPREVPCFFRCLDEMQMIQHIRKNHSDYILPAPHLIRSSDILMDPEKNRMLILIYLNEYQYKMAVLTREKSNKRMKIRCRMIMDDPHYCILGMDPPSSDAIQCFSCIPLGRPRCEKEDDDEVYKIRFSRFKTERILSFTIEETDSSIINEVEDILTDAIKTISLI